MSTREHEIKSIALAYVKCECGWRHRLENLKGKTDETLSQETQAYFTEHQRLCEIQMDDNN